MTREYEATLHCKCGSEATLYRVPADHEGVWTHETEPEVKRGECPKCGGPMVRK